MSWSILSTQDVLNEFTAAEQAQLQNIQGGTNELAAILDKTVKRVRSMIKAGGNMLDQSGITIPDQLAEETIAMARWHWLTSFPALKSLKTPDREKANADALVYLEKIASNAAACGIARSARYHRRPDKCGSTCAARPLGEDRQF